MRRNGKGSVGRDWRLCVIIDAQNLRGRSPEDVARAAIAGGADVLQLRDKISSGDAFYREAVSVNAVCRDAGVPLIINDRLDIAIAAEADGAHLGQDDLPARAARPLLGSCRILGISAGNAKEAATGQSDGADYIGAGPVFEARSTKPDAASPMGLSGLAEICRATTLPVIAIGGINTGNIGPVFEAGAAGVAAISAVLLSEDVESATRALKAAVPTRK